MRVALDHWLVTIRGGEEALEALCDVCSNVEIFTLVRRPGQTLEQIKRAPKLKETI